MLVLFETAAGFSLFKVKDMNKLMPGVDLAMEFQNDANGVVELVSFQKFPNGEEAVASATALAVGELDKTLSRFLKSNLKTTNEKKLLVSELKLGQAIKQKLEIDCSSIEANPIHADLLRGIREKLGDLIPGLSEAVEHSMQVAVAHQLSRYKLKFSPDKLDTMICQAIGLLDELDKEINTYSMRVREWYGWHFPEMAKIVVDGLQYAKIVQLVGVRSNFRAADLSSIIEDENIEEAVKTSSMRSMGTDISTEDLNKIQSLCDQVVSMSAYRGQLSEYLKNRMNSLAPNLTVMVGELVGARLIAHAGSLMNLAKAPGSTIQILGAEKALFRALKTKHDTPKYGMIFHASLMGQATPKNKGKIARMLASKAALAIRIDALSENPTASAGYECRQKVEARLRQLETGEPYKLLASAATTPAIPRGGAAVAGHAAAPAYNYEADATDLVAPRGEDEKKKKKKKRTADEFVEQVAPTEVVTGGKSEKKHKAKKHRQDE